MKTMNKTAKNSLILMAGVIGLLACGLLAVPAGAQIPAEPLPGAPGAERVLGSDERRHSYRLDLAAGEFLRVAGTVRDGAVSVRLLGPRGDTILRSYVPLEPYPILATVVARQSGPHVLEVARLSETRGERDTTTVRYRIRRDEHLSPARYRKRLDSLERDPRVRWLSENAIALRTLSLEDDDLSDLEPLRDAISEARIVLLGEESHASGRTIAAMSRLVRFLHEKMGFGVLAFESGLYDMWKVRQRLQAGQEPSETFAYGLLGTWSRAADFQPLARYLGRHAHGPSPLEVAGLTMHRLPPSREELLPEMRQLFGELGVAAGSGALPANFWDTLEQYITGEFWDRPGAVPERAEREDFLAALRWTAGRVAERGDAEGSAGARTPSLWSQVLRNLAASIRTHWIEVTGEDPGPYDTWDLRMARNLEWLARKYHPDRKIIVWAANPHVLRRTYRIDGRGTSHFGGCCPMGQYVWEMFGERSFVIAATAYAGRFRWRAWDAPPDGFAVNPDQDPAFELEELLEAAGFEQAVLPLRDLPAGGDWLRGPTFSRMPWNYWTFRGVWPDHADAILFLRSATPRVTASRFR